MKNMNENGKMLCMSALYANHLVLGDSHFYNSSRGKDNSSFGFIVKGSVILIELSRANKKTKIPEGGLFYIPEGVRYS